jgi:predicted component of type VI protein secretion system
MNDIVQTIESDIATGWNAVVTFLTKAEQDIGAFLSSVAAGEQILLSDVQAAAQYINGHAAVLSSSVAAVTNLANTLAPNNAAVQKAVSGLNTGLQDVTQVASDLVSGANPNDPALVTKTVTGVTAAQQLQQATAAVGALLTTLAAASPAATQAVSAPTPPAG